ncbi:MAG: adenosylcobinamide-GDP ribazoletransferase [Tateyamaria sp.]|jgi:adenosylcobinamide-GDP ribazoletransferase|nr:adenosylcobinamide-GDP ribazoletransferase [Tateyamaria sp.]MBT7447927.1 adenosylcobinamide-GDP ribazoletransferase [Tateyamaria sp.]MBT7799798.1 adenosylcobinamide-GDP ribazoletransferase [Tateyamaria sp.]
METKKTDRSLAKLWDLAVAMVLLTRLPLPDLPKHAFSNPARSVWAYPIVGLILGIIVGLVSWVCTKLNFSDGITAGIILGALIILTGAMHEDGLADTFDGLWGGLDITKRLEIMRDSHIGVYGVLALIVATGLRWLSLTEVTVTDILTALVISRAMMPLLMWAMPNARETGLSHSIGRPRLTSVVIGIFIAAAIGIILSGGLGIAALVVAVGVATLVGSVASNKIGGQTGDILGATQLLAEISILMVLIS